MQHKTISQLFMAAILWSGGKDSAVTAFRAQEQGLKIHYLIPMIYSYLEINANEPIIYSSAIPLSILNEQANSIGATLAPLQYESVREFKNQDLVDLLLKLKNASGITHLGFGEGNCPLHFLWHETVCNTVGLIPFAPIDHKNETSISSYQQFLLDKSFKYIITAVTRHIPYHFAGSEFSQQYIDDCKNEKICPVASDGYCHSFCYDGPIFSKPIGWKHIDTKTIPTSFFDENNKTQPEYTRFYLITNDTA